MRPMQTLVELVEFHEHTAVSIVKTESTLHTLQGFLFLLLFVEIAEGKVTPYRRECRVKICRLLPVTNGNVIPTLVVIETAQIVGSLGTLGVQDDGTAECQDIFQTVRETAVTVGLFRLPVKGPCLIGQPLALFEIS